MTDSTDTGDGGTNSLERIVDGLLAAEAARELKEAVDLEAILADQPADEPVDVDRLADALGRPVGRLLAHRIVDAGGMTGFAKRRAVTDAGDRVATRRPKPRPARSTSARTGRPTPVRPVATSAVGIRAPTNR